MNEGTIWQDMENRLAELAAADLLRRPVVLEATGNAQRVRLEGREVVCLCSNDYLGLANDPAVKAAAMAAIERYGVGAGASRLVSGTTALHVQLEARLAAFKGTEAAVVTPTGWMANHVAIHALAGSGDLVLCDKLNHASILDAAMSCGARVRTYAHCDMDRLESLLARHRGEHKRCLIVTDSLFSMDGDLAPLREIAELKDRFDAQLLIDEAHATGVFGEHGRGVAEHLGVEDRIDATVGTLSKAIGCLGGFVVGPKVLADTIRNTGRPYIYTTALPPALCAAAMASLDIIDREPQRRRKLLAMAGRLRDELVHGGTPKRSEAELEGVDPSHPQAERRLGVPPMSQIIPILIGEVGRAVEVSRKLLEAGFLVPAIRPPTVPKGTSRLRVSLSAGHQDADIAAFVEMLRKVLG